MKVVRRLSVLKWISALATVVVLGWWFLNAPSEIPRATGNPTAPDSPPAPKPHAPTAAELLLEGYADPATPPIEDLRKIHRAVTGYFSVVKDASRFPIGGNADLAAALRGETPDREVFVPIGHPVFSAEGLFTDRWGSPVIVHPEAWKQLELRSAGPDKTPYTEDDLILAPSGAQR